MRKPHDMSCKRFAARLTEFNNFLLVFPGSDTTKKMPTEELNEILLHAVPKNWAKQLYLQVWDFEMELYRETCAMFKRMEIAEQVYKGKSPSKKILGYMPTVTVMSINERE